VEGRAAIQRDPDQLEESINGKLRKFTEDNYQILPLGWPNPCTHTGWGLPGWGAALLGRLWASSELSMGQQPALAAGMASSIPGCMNSKARRSKEQIIPLYSAVIRSHRKLHPHFHNIPYTTNTKI